VPPALDGTESQGAALTAVKLLASGRNPSVFQVSPELKAALEAVNRVRLDVSQFEAPLLEIARTCVQGLNEKAGWLKSLGAFDDSLKRVRESSWLKEFSETLTAVQKNREGFERLLEGLSPRLDAANHFLEKLASFDYEAYTKQERRSLQFAAKYGWFPQPEAPASLGKQVAGYTDNPQGLDQLFVEVTEPILEAIEARLAASYPEQAHIFREAFALHREGRYIASVPLLFLGADAISSSQTKTSVFTQSRKQTKYKARTQVVEWVDGKVVSPGMDPFFELICGQHALNLPSMGLLNRHKVMHGEDTNYHSRENSFRAVSFLGFVGWLLSPSEGHLSEPSPSVTGTGTAPPAKVLG
jgi:hypothetical protein